MEEIVNDSESIEQKFKKQNNKILIDNVLRQIEENSSSLKLILHNCISLISERFLKKINKILKEEKYSLQELCDLFLKYRKIVEKIAFDFVEERKKYIIANSIVDESFLDSSFSDVVDSFVAKNIEAFEETINDNIYLSLERDIRMLIKTYSSEAQRESISSTLGSFDYKITAAIEDAIGDRNRSLKILVFDTCDKVESLNNQTEEISQALTKVST